MARETHTQQLPFDAYRGGEAYFFASYSHEDADLVYPELVRLRAEGFNIWYDEGISPGHSWPDELAKAINYCALLVMFVTPRSVRSRNCTQEINFAHERDKPILAVHLEETDLPDGLQLTIGDRQAIIRSQLAEAAYRQKLTDAISEYVPCSEPSLPPEPPSFPVAARQPTKRRWPLVAAISVAVTGLVAFSIFQYQESASQRRWAIEERLPEAERLAANGLNIEAYAKALELDKLIPENPRLVSLWLQISEIGSLHSEPSGADVVYRPYSAPDTEWTSLGATPLENIRLPRAALVYKIDSAGYSPAHIADMNPGRVLGNEFDGASLSVTLTKSVPPDQIYVPAVTDYISLNNFPDRYETGPFLIDMHEVTNQQYNEFVEAGGYTEKAFWEGLTFLDEGQELTWDEATRDFGDSTGRPGPATWELGRYPAGQASWPVSGISWYEAVAYARFRGRDLPTRFHWGRAANGFNLGQAIIQASNFGGQGASPVGSTKGMGPFGTYDMAGNVREWVWNERGSHRMTLGGAWDDPKYMFLLSNSLPPTDRSATNGFRTVEYLDEGPTEQQLEAFVLTEERDLANLKPYGDEAYNALTRQFDYSRSVSLGGEITTTRESNRGWRRETVVIDSAYAPSGFKAYVYLPLDAKPPVQPVIYFPGLNSFETSLPSESDDLLETPSLTALDFVIRSGRAFIWPVYHGSYERHDDVNELDGVELVNAWRLRRVRWRSDVGEVIDYLESRPDIAADKIAYLGYSFGATTAPILLALEDRFKAAILLAGGVPGRNRASPLTDNVHYLPRVRLPTLLLSGRYDYVIPLRLQDALFELLGTPMEDKKHVTFQIEHRIPPRNELMTHAVDWLDRYLGPVN